METSLLNSKSRIAPDPTRQVYLNPEVKSGLGEKTFWVWMNEDVWPGCSTFDYCHSLNPGEALLQYSTLGADDLPSKAGDAKTIGLCFELHHEMRRALGSDRFNIPIHHSEQVAAACDRRVVSSRLCVPDFDKFGDVDVLPIGVDTDLFSPVASDTHKEDLRANYGVPIRKKVAFWCGTKHQMKGFDRLRQFANKNPHVHFVIVWKSKREQVRNHGVACSEWTHTTQDVFADLLRLSDFSLFTGMLRPFFMVEWEAMASGLSVVDVAGVEREFTPSSTDGESNRAKVFELGWDRNSAAKVWRDYVGGSD